MYQRNRLENERSMQSGLDSTATAAAVLAASPGTFAPAGDIRLGSRGDWASQNEPSGGKPRRDAWDWLLCAVILCGLPVLLFLTVRNGLIQPLLLEAEHHQWIRLILRPTILWMVMGIVLLAFRTICWLRYRPFPPATFADAPFLTVIIPAYNEGAMVLNAIESAATANYPQDRLEVFAVDDGSTDDTWTYIREAAARFPDVVKPIRFDKNQGKRAALSAGFRRSRGSVLVTVDSDSVVEPNSLLAIAGPFRDPKVGAVAGRVMVFNRREGVIPRMLHVRFILAFDFLRAVESSFRNVFCCPGALTAFRASVVLEVLDRWSHQTFLGSPCTIGEDRAMTNLVFGCGFDTVYQRTAAVHTVAPSSYQKLCRMLLRWDRSYIREEFCFLRVLWKRPLRTRIIALCDRAITNLRYPVHYASIVMILFLVAHHPAMIARFLLAVGLISLYNMFYYLRSERSLDFCYGIVWSYFELATLFWIFPYAFLTVRARGWLTR